jgi:8-oxo-dGTP pyrophosphatase MutT (NUDIX family)
MTPTDHVDVVDTDDRVLGTKARDALIDGVDRWRIIVVLVTDGAGRTLLAKRSATKRHDPGMWTAAVTGTVDAGETPDAAAVRETAEELGLHVDTGELRRGPWDRPGQLRNLTLYELRRPVDAATLTFDTDEIDAVAWISLTELDLDLAEHPHSYVARAAELLAHLARRAT